MGELESIIFNSNIDNFNDSASEFYLEEVLEYEIYIDAPVRGRFEYGPYTFSVWEIGPDIPGKEKRLCLKITVRVPKELLGDEHSQLDVKFVFGEKISIQLIALASLFLRRRFKYGGIVRMGNNPIMLTGFRDGLIDKDLLDGESRLNDLSEYFDQVKCLDEVLQGDFLQAAMLYSQAIQDIETQPTLAWLTLVSSIEVLSQNFDVGDVDLSEIDKGLARAVRKIEDQSLREEISNRIIKRMTSIRRRFVKFVLAYLDESFWEYAKRPNKEQWGEMFRIDPGSLEAYLGNIYKQRSRALHDGEPFPIMSVTGPPIEYAEIPSGADPNQESLPHLQFFERLVRHVLINYLKRHSCQQLGLEEA